MKQSTSILILLLLQGPCSATSAITDTNFWEEPVTKTTNNPSPGKKRHRQNTGTKRVYSRYATAALTAVLVASIGYYSWNQFSKTSKKDPASSNPGQNPKNTAQKNGDIDHPQDTEIIPAEIRHTEIASILAAYDPKNGNVSTIVGELDQGQHQQPTAEDLARFEKECGMTPDDYLALAIQRANLSNDRLFDKLQTNIFAKRLNRYTSYKSVDEHPQKKVIALMIEKIDHLVDGLIKKGSEFITNLMSQKAYGFLKFVSQLPFEQLSTDTQNGVSLYAEGLEREVVKTLTFLAGFKNKTALYHQIILWSTIPEKYKGPLMDLEVAFEKEPSGNDLEKTFAKIIKKTADPNETGTDEEDASGKDFTQEEAKQLIELFVQDIGYRGYKQGAVLKEKLIRSLQGLFPKNKA